MRLDVKIGDSVSSVELLEKKGNSYVVKLDDKIFEIDSIEINPGIYSVIHNGKSYFLDIFNSSSPKKFETNGWNNSYPVEIIDAETKYQMIRGKGVSGENENIISSPMPGKIVKVLVKPGDEVKAGDTVVIVSAMKMESEYKVGKDSVVKEVLVADGDTVNGNQPLVIIE